MACVICAGERVEELCSHRPSISTDRRVLDVATRTLVCLACGSAWNEGGARSQELDFYAEHYDLHGESAASEWQVYVEGDRRGENDAILEFVEANAALAPAGRLLEVGCGKGVLLGKFLRAHPGWSAAGVEPSRNAVAYFAEVLPGVRIHEGPFETAPFRDERFDFVGSSGVLEHVPDPAAFLRGLRGCLQPGARCYVGVPNFRAKPDDLLLFDHLVHFTPDALDVIYARVGLRLIARSATDDRVWLWDLVEATEPATPAPAAQVVERGLALARAHRDAVTDGLETFERFLGELGEGETGALFGLGVLGVLALERAGARAARVRYALDDNPHLWGQRKGALEVQGSEAVRRLGIDRAFLSANPCYHERMARKLEGQGLDPARIYRWGGA
ncbi:MAG: class I SAM-dependent methyltransferase [Planctomycetota bacterium]